MRAFWARLSLRYKLLVMLTILPVGSVALYLLIATDLLQKDKVAYVYNSSAVVAHGLASEMRISIRGDYTNLRMIADRYEGHGFTGVGRELFNKNEKVYALELFRRQSDGNYKKLGELAKDNAVAKGFVRDPKIFDLMRDQAVEHGAHVAMYPGLPGSIIMAFRLGEKTDVDYVVMIALYKANELVGAFETIGMYDTAVMTRSGRLSIGSEADETDLSELHGLLKANVSEGAVEARLKDGHLYLVSYADTGVGDMVVISKVDKTKALDAIDVLIFKSILFFFAVNAAALLISIYASSTMTESLRQMFRATRKIAEGDFSVRVDVQWKDEFGNLAESFNYMASVVSHLMNETAEKARLEGELSTVHAAQETLFPGSQCRFGPIRVRGHFEPASVAGGDWWNYSRVGDKLFIWIGDVTGHGAHTTLLTAAARSAAAVIEALPKMTPGQVMSILNYAIHETSKGQNMMTFFVASIDPKKGEFTYANASHDPPYLMKYSGERLSKKDLVPLFEVNGPRLGEAKIHQYKDTTIAFKPGDMVFLYTDGILDIQNQTGGKWGERAFLRSLIDCANSESTVDKMDDLLKVADGFRSGSPLMDDVTMVLVEFDMQARKKAVA
jgi:sigma-B regulation protein RsbU (phosphoserine phosphatase)